MSNTFKIGDKLLLPIELKGRFGAYNLTLLNGKRWLYIYPEDYESFIPARTLTEAADYLEALGDALTLMPPEMRDPRDVADEIREMLS